MTHFHFYHDTAGHVCLDRDGQRIARSHSRCNRSAAVGRRAQREIGYATQRREPARLTGEQELLDDLLKKDSA